MQSNLKTLLRCFQVLASFFYTHIVHSQANSTVSSNSLDTIYSFGRFTIFTIYTIVEALVSGHLPANSIKFALTRAGRMSSRKRSHGKTIEGGYLPSEIH